jgi:double-stranded uracil-DNA glycosylase
MARFVYTLRMRIWKPTPAQLRAATDKTVPDVIAPRLAVLFCGINPGLYSGAVGHHFARPGNRFWPALHAAGFTPRQLSPFEERGLLAWKLGITNLVMRSTASADALSASELSGGGRRLAAKIKRYQPGVLAVLGITAYRQAFGKRAASLGLQPEPLGRTAIWVLPNPSGLNAHYQPKALRSLFRALRAFVATRGLKGEKP